MFSSYLNKNLLRNNINTFIFNKRLLRNGQRRTTILDDYAYMYRPEVESQLEDLAIKTTRNKSLQINYEIEYEKKKFYY